MGPGGAVVERRRRPGWWAPRVVGGGSALLGGVGGASTQTPRAGRGTHMMFWKRLCSLVGGWRKLGVVSLAPGFADSPPGLFLQCLPSPASPQLEGLGLHPH